MEFTQEEIDDWQTKWGYKYLSKCFMCQKTFGSDGANQTFCARCDNRKANFKKKGGKYK